MHDDVAGVLAGAAQWAVVQGDVLEWLAALPADSVDLLVTSPPYERARTYLEGGKDLSIARGTEEWVAWMVEVCRAARRVCKGLCAFVVEGQTAGYRYTASPFLLAADLHRAGFHLRKTAVYHRYGIPGSGGTDWLRNNWEPILCFTRGGRLPWSDPLACGHEPIYEPGGEVSYRTLDGTRINERAAKTKSVTQGGAGTNGGKGDARTVRRKVVLPEIANPGNVIHCQAGGGRIGSKLAHQSEAPFPEKLAAFFVRSFCPPGGVVADPFSGSGTTVAVALEWGRRGIGCDLRPSQVTLSRKRIAAVTPPIPGLLPAAPGPAGGPLT